jgi:hypothetical protein
MLSNSNALKLDDARKEAKKIQGAVAQGGDPVEQKRKEREEEARAREAARLAPLTSVKGIIESYFTIECGMVRDAEGKATFNDRKRSAQWQMRYVFESLVYPQIGDIQVNDIKRSEIVNMLDRIATENGPVMADRTLANLRKAFNWYASRSDDFRSPIVKGMAKTKPKERAGTRVLADDEIRDIWTVCETGGKDCPPHSADFSAFCFLPHRDAPRPRP